MSSERMAVALLFVAVVVMASLVPARSDTWWLIRAGQDIWETGSIPVTDSYSHTIQGRPWPNHEWLTDVFFYGAYHTAGMPGLAALCVGLIVFAWALSWLLMSGRFELRFTLFALSLTASAGAWAMRPQLVTMACFMVACWLLATHRIWWLPLHFLLWANLHGAVVLGVIAIGAVGLAEIIRTRRIPLQLVAVGAVSATMTLVTPLGLDLWALLATYGAGPRGQGIEEWIRPDLPPANPAFWASVAALLVGVSLRTRSLDVPGSRLTAIALAMLPFALSARRNIAVFLLVAVPAVSALWAQPFQAEHPVRLDRNRVNTVIVGFAAITAMLFVFTVWRTPSPARGWLPIRPEAAAAVEACRGPLYNTYDDGGALIWFAPTKPVFIDSRYDPYPVDLFTENERVERSGSYGRLFSAYKIACAIVPIGMPTELALRQDPGWSKTHSDDRHAVYVARSGP